MVRKLVGALSLAALVATGASAQVPFQQTFTYVGGTFPAVIQAKFASGGNIGLTGELPGVAFQIWCVDPLQTVSNQTYSNAWITPLNTTAANFNHTLAEYAQTGHAALTGAVAALDYQKAAYLAGAMMLSHAGYTNSDYEEAIWQTMGYTGHTGTKANQIIAAMNSTSAWTSVVLADWGVITAGTGVQEFLYHRDTGHFLSVTPEPATMGMLAMGLVGMGGTSLRRRKRKA